MKALLSIIAMTTMLFLGERNTFRQGNISNTEAIMTTDTMTYPAKNISVSINRSAAEVYRFVSNPENFPQWVAFVKSITRQGDFWIAESELGTIRIKFAAPNEFGIIDHHVTLTNGETVYNPMRVIANNRGSQFIFTLFRLPGRTDEAFNEDAKAVTNDLQKLKEIMENK